MTKRVTATGRVGVAPSRDERAAPLVQGAPILLTLPEAAHMLGISERMVKRLVQSGDLAVVRIGRCRRFHRRDIEAFAGLGRMPPI